MTAFVSWFQVCTASTPTDDRELPKVLEQIRSGAWRGLVQAIRAESDKDKRNELKKRLPAFTPCGTFTGSRKAANMSNRSGFIMLDIDGMETTTKAADARDALNRNPHAAAAFISASGLGVAVLVRIQDPPEWCETANDARRYYAAAYEAASASIGMDTDEACKDATRLRFVSDDPGLWSNWDANPLHVPMERETVKPTKQPASQYTYGNDDQETVIRCLAALGNHRADDYHDWVKVGMAIHSAGLPCHVWDDWSRRSPKWREGACAEKWKTFSGQGVSLASLVFMAKQDTQGFSPRERMDWTPSATHDGPATDYDYPEPEEAAIPPPAGDGDVPHVLDMLDAAEWLAMEDEQIDPLMPELFERGDKVLLSGASKSRKSFFALQMCLSLAAGAPFLRWQAVQPRKVLLFQLEIKPYHFKGRVRGLLNSMGIRPDAIAGRFSIVNGRGKVTNLMQLMDTVDAFAPDLVVIDPAYKLIADECDTEQVSEFLNTLDKMAEKSGACIFYVHHHAKGNGGDRSSRDRASGSGRFARDYDAGFDMTAHADQENTLVLTPDSRNHLTPEPFCIQWLDGRFCDAPDIEPEVKTSESAARKRAKEKSAKPVVQDAAIMAMVKTCGPMLAGVFEDKVMGLGCTRNDARTMRARLIDEGLLVAVKIAGAGNVRKVGLPSQMAVLKNA